MSDLVTLRRLLGGGTGTTTGMVTDVSPQGVVQVLTGSKVLACQSLVDVKAGDRVRVQGLVILSKIDQIAKDIPVFRV